MKMPSTKATMSSTAMTHTKLPNEIWWVIMSLIQAEIPIFDFQDKNTLGMRTGCRELAAICRVSKRFRAFAQPLLYRRITIGPSIVRGAKFVRTLGERRDLARLVRYFDEDETRMRSAHERTSSFTLEYYQQCEESLNRIRSSVGDDEVVDIILSRLGQQYVNQGMAGLCWESEMVFFLLLCPNVETLFITDDGSPLLRVNPDESLLNVIFKKATMFRTGQSDDATRSSNQPLMRFNKLNAHASQICQLMRMDSVLAYQGVTEIDIGFIRGHSIPSPNSPVDNIQQLADKAPHLRRLFFHESSLDVATVTHLLAGLKNLRALRISNGFPSHPNPKPWPAIELDQLGTVLREHGQQLGTLHIAEKPLELMKDGGSRIGCLQPLYHLAELSIQYHHLVGHPLSPDGVLVHWGGSFNTYQNDLGQYVSNVPYCRQLKPLLLVDVLPNSLQVLYLYQCDATPNAVIDYLVDDLLGLLGSSQFPNLREITIFDVFELMSSHELDEKAIELGWLVARKPVLGKANDPHMYPMHRPRAIGQRWATRGKSFMWFVRRGQEGKGVRT